MLKSAIATALLGASIVTAAAQTPPPEDAVPLKLPRPMIQAIGTALMKAPYETSAPILAELQRQLEEANKPKPPADQAPKSIPSQ